MAAVNKHAPLPVGYDPRVASRRLALGAAKGPAPVKSYDSRTYSINDFVEWDNGKQLELNPRFQRRSVWSDKAKSYLIDTIMRGKPIPKVFIRQKINVSTKISLREVVDGQQRLRTILSFVKDGFVVSRTHNREYGGMYFSQLSEDVQANILSYEVSVDILFNLPDAEVLDIFGRLNSYAVVLNEQEKLNALHFGEFKVEVDEVARRYNEYWIAQKIFSPNQVLRMLEVNLTADLYIAMIEGIRAKKQIAGFYARYEKTPPAELSSLEIEFDQVVHTISDMFSEGLSGSMFAKPFLFYSLFTTVYHCLYGMRGLDEERIELTSKKSVVMARNKLDRVELLFAVDDTSDLPLRDRQFLQDSRRGTTDIGTRTRRTAYLLESLQLG